MTFEPASIRTLQKLTKGGPPGVDFDYELNAANLSSEDEDVEKLYDVLEKNDKNVKQFKYEPEEVKREEDQINSY